MSDSESPSVNHDSRRGSARRWFQFHLRGFLIFVALLAVILGIIGRHLYLQQRRSDALAMIKEMGGLVANEAGKVAKNKDRIERVFLTGITDEQLKQIVPHLTFLPHVRQLDIVESDVTDAGLVALGDLTGLERLFVYNTKATSAGLTRLSGTLPQLKIKQELPEPIATGLAMRPIYRHAIAALEVSPDGRWLAAGDGRGRLALWELGPEGRPSGLASSIPAHQSWLFDAAFSSDGRLLATGGGDNKIILWELPTLRRVAELAGHTDDVHAVAFAQSDRKLVSAGDDMTVRIWDVASQTVEHVLTGHEGTIPCMAISPDGRTAATGSRDGDVRLWNIETGELIQVMDGHEADVTSVAFHAEGAMLVSASYDKTIRVWPLQHNEPPRTLVGHTDWIFTIALAPDSRLISGGRDGTVRSWDLLTGRLIATRDGQGIVSRIAALPHGSLLSVASAEGRIRFWDTSLAKCRAVIRVDFEDPAFAIDGSPFRFAGSGRAL